MLSVENIEKLNMYGLYKCNPDAKYRSSWHKDNLYHCCNWTFHVVVSNDGSYFMRDTYWSSGDSVYIHLTDENFHEFEFIFHVDKVRKIHPDDAKHYEKYYRVAIDSGGIYSPKYFVDIDAGKSRDLVLKDVDDQIKSLETDLRYLKDKRENIASGKWSV